MKIAIIKAPLIVLYACFFFSCAGEKEEKDTFEAKIDVLPELIDIHQEIIFDYGAETTEQFETAEEQGIDIFPEEDQGEIPEQGKFGAPCMAPEDCESSLCIEGFDGNVCTTTCSGQCPSGYKCTGVSVGGDFNFLCVPLVTKLCHPCKEDFQCPGGKCKPIGKGTYCTITCENSNECPETFQCEEIEDSPDPILMCLPKNGTCDCNENTKGYQRICENKNNDGVCQGVETCDPEKGWVECSAKTPAAEVCDGEDNDCNGTMDDGLIPPLCENQKGVCEGSVKMCGGIKAWLPCSSLNYGEYYEFVEVACDKKDNDCNGSTDDVDKDKDGYIDAECEGGNDCDDMNPLTFPSAPEICGDGLDNDCNGIPEDRDFDGDGHISSACGGDDCNDATNLVNPDLAEVCQDGLDNDCDGSIDNKDIDGDGFIDKACGGQDCDDTIKTVNPDGIEECNGLDDDCNGLIDDKDLDGDGYLDSDPVCGGNDCDDNNFYVNPGTKEICGDIGNVDEDCSGSFNDRDLDKDGYIDDSPTCGGNDCDDLDPVVHPSATEIYDAKDTDCDGLVDEGLIPAGSIIVSEIMQNPSGVIDDLGEYFEVYNTWFLPVNMDSWVVKDKGVDMFIIDAPDGLIVQPGAVAVLCRNDNYSINGGISCDYDYDNFILAQGPDEVIMLLENVEIDRVEYDSGITFPDPKGQSMNLDPNAFTKLMNNNGANWCVTPVKPSFVLDDGDYGSPGKINPSCSGDPVVKSVSPNNGIDNGGETVIIHGSGFTGVTDVKIGTVSCSSWLVLNDNEIKCVTPSGNASDADVTVVKSAKSYVLTDGYRYTGEAVVNINWCDIQWPKTVTTEASVPTVLIYGQVRSPGVTEPAGAPASIKAQIGYGQYLSDPRNEPGWLWFDAIWNKQYYNNDEFMQILTVSQKGTYSFAYRFSDDNGFNFMYGDFDPGTADGFNVNNMGKLTVK